MKIITALLISLLGFSGHSQVAMSFKDAPQKGIEVKTLDSNYKSAIDSDLQKAVFKTDAEIEKHITAYQEFLMNFGAFLEDNNFKWEENTRAFNRIYMRPDGTIDYFLYQFNTTIPEVKEKEFNRLLNIYIKDRKFGITANEKFAQCSPVTYPKSE